MAEDIFATPHSRFDDPCLPRGVDSVPEAEAASEVRRLLMSRGYAYLEEFVSLQSYERIAGLVGTIAKRADIRIDRTRDQVQREHRTLPRPSVYSAGALGFHTDPIADMVSWYCVEQDAMAGAMLLLDCQDIAERFAAAELQALSRVHVYSFTRESESQMEKATEEQLLTATSRGYRIFFAPWLVQDPDDPNARAALTKFLGYVRQKEAEELMTLPIKKNQYLFIDNHRMLHGRGPIPESSKRHLVRFYITKAETWPSIR